MKSLLSMGALLLVMSSITMAQTKIYVSDAGNFNNPPWQILSYDLDGSNAEVYISEELAWPQDIVFLADQNEVLVSNLNSGRITKYAANTGTYIGDFATVSGGPTRMKIGDDGLLYVLQWSTTDNHVKRYQLDGTFVDEFTTVGVSRSIGLDWDAAGNLYVSSYGSSHVRQYDPSGNNLGLFIETDLNGPTNIEILDSGNILVLNWNAGNVAEFDSDGNFLGTFIPGLSQPEGIAVLPNGNLLIGNGVNANPGEVLQFLIDGTFVETSVPAGSGGLIQPNAVILFDPSTLSIPEHNLSTAPFVTPSAGNTFAIHGAAFENYDRVQVFSITGHLVDTLSSEMQQWNASRLQAGVYFIIATGVDTKRTQKIIVEN